MYRHRPRHRPARVTWRPSAGTVALLLTWAGIVGVIFGGSS